MLSIALCQASFLKSFHGFKIYRLAASRMVNKEDQVEQKTTETTPQAP